MSPQTYLDYVCRGEPHVDRAVSAACADLRHEHRAA
jgi:hypothetical protein